MAGKPDQVKGRIKEALGSLTADDDLRNEGRVDRLGGEAKEKLGQAKDKVEDVIEKAKDHVEDLIDKAKGLAQRK